MAGSGSILGNAVLRLEDPTLLEGKGKYVDDLVEASGLFVSFARSTVAHGTIVSLDVSAAESMPGVVAVYHAGNDLGLPSFQGFPMMPDTLNRPIFAKDRVRFVGDIVTDPKKLPRLTMTDTISSLGAKTASYQFIRKHYSGGSSAGTLAEPSSRQNVSTSPMV